jgi:hypothetical protein
MDKLAWVLSATIGAVAIVGAVCNALVRNTILAIALSMACSVALWWYLTGAPRSVLADCRSRGRADHHRGIDFHGDARSRVAARRTPRSDRIVAVQAAETAAEDQIVVTDGTANL